MKSNLSILALALCMTTVASAGGHEQPPTGGTNNTANNTAYGGNSVSASRAEARATAAALAILRSSNVNSNTNAGGAGGVGQGGKATSSANNSGQSQNLTIQGAQPGSGGVVSTVYERSAPSVSVPPATVPTQSCRLTIGGGGSNTSGGLGVGVPIGNDETCLAAIRLAMMERIGGFTQEDKLRTVCNVEGMGITSACKALSATASQ
jgi:hypothetical protein